MLDHMLATFLFIARDNLGMVLPSLAGLRPRLKSLSKLNFTIPSLSTSALHLHRRGSGKPVRPSAGGEASYHGARENRKRKRELSQGLDQEQKQEQEQGVHLKHNP